MSIFDYCKIWQKAGRMLSYILFNHICQALDLIGPICRVMDSFAGVREKTGAIFMYGLILMRQENLQDAR